MALLSSTWILEDGIPNATNMAKMFRTKRLQPRPIWMVRSKYFFSPDSFKTQSPLSNDILQYVEHVQVHLFHNT